ncbi:MAG: hypothetical protein ACK4UJ_05365 [Leptonema sp. (in: bacteria)]
MKLTNSKYRLEGDVILWIFYSNKIEFTREEFEDLVQNIRKIGLFPYLEKERITLKHLLLKIISDSIESSYWETTDPKIPKEKKIESFLEQCILEIYYKIKR